VTDLDRVIAEADTIIGALHEGLFRLSDLVERIRPHDPGNPEAVSMHTPTRGNKRRDRAILIDKVLKVLEFAWGTGVLDLSTDEYADCMATLFPDRFCDDVEVKRRIQEVRGRKLGLFRDPAD
jgi:hypothetical protein